jgi:hypothetical protein
LLSANQEDAIELMASSSALVNGTAVFGEAFPLSASLGPNRDSNSVRVRIGGPTRPNRNLPLESRCFNDLKGFEG